MEKFDFEIEHEKKKKKLKKTPLYILGCVLCLVIGGIGGYFVSQTHIIGNKGNSSTLYDQIAEIIDSDFLDTTESKTDIHERMLAGMVAAIGDPHSNYLTNEQANDLGTTINGSFTGIGVTFTTVDVGGLVLDVYQDTPAQKAGILSGDILTHVEGTSIAGYSSDKIKNTIQGESGTTVKIRLLRDGKEKEVSVTRSAVDTAVAYEVRKSGDQKIGYLRLTTFGEGMSAKVELALQLFKAQNIDNLVIDLRGNGGGYLTAAQEVLDLLVPSGETFVKIEPVNGKEEVYKASNRDKYTFKNGYILVDGNSASASEVTAGALKELLNYQLIGEKTYGKGTVQTQKVLSDSSVIKYTHAKWLTPGGTWVNGKGIDPDYEVKNTTMSDFHISEMKKEYQYDQADDNIKYMQEMLKELGYKVDRVDGYFSKATTEALKTFEKDYGLTVNGIYDKNDATILLSALSYHVSNEVEDNQYKKVEELVK